ncbi:endonuclease/exonuclease/phosphatase family protein [Pleomorphovibrio marinus]|uniref:endonuclease/exonuclease/phosphatase family protein n=1 Tax=Pleomorphovibrio marinus TaxID=2164132 RepID=UPI000E0A0F3F|nr:endonuclease/exonuclease/phosphatase family protein [Pleomorphovibrio marinus]
MRSLVFLFSFLVFLGFRYPVTAQTEPLKVITYNIWNGFDWGKDQEREAAMVQWLQEQDADVIGFQELNDFTPEKLQSLAQEWGHPYSILLKEEGYPIGITSKTPLEMKTKMIGGMWHGMLHAKTREVDFLVVHLSPQDWEFRRREARIICDYLQEAILLPGQEKYMVLGDFNAHSPYDASFDANNPQARRLSIVADSLSKAEKGEEAFINLRNKRIDYSAMSTFLSLPLIDVVQMKVAETNRKSFPTPLATRDMPASEAAIYQQRLDYILVSPYFEDRCSYAEIINYGEPEKLSDHFPVIAAFDF